MILSRAKDYYENNKEIKEKTYLKKKKTKRENMEKNRYHNMPQGKTKICQKNYHETKKLQYNNQ